MMCDMTTPLPPTHCASVVCRVPAALAFAFLADGLQLGQWAMGCWQAQPVGDGIVRGHSLFDDQPSWVRPVADAARLTIVYHVGASADALNPRISAVVEPGAVVGQGEDCCRISLHASRSSAMDDDRWLRLVRCHEVEVLLIQARLELRKQHG